MYIHTPLNLTLVPNYKTLFHPKIISEKCPCIVKKPRNYIKIQLMKAMLYWEYFFWKIRNFLGRVRVRVEGKIFRYKMFFKRFVAIKIAVLKFQSK